MQTYIHTLQQNSTTKKYVDEHSITMNQNTCNTGIPCGHWAPVLSAPFSIKLPANAPKKAAHKRSHVWDPESTGETQMKPLVPVFGRAQLQQLWPFGSEPVDGSWVFCCICNSAFQTNNIILVGYFGYFQILGN